MGVNIAHVGKGDINLTSSPDLEFLQEAYKAEALAVLPARLRDREAEQAELIHLTETDGYAWYQGPPWAGKSALMSWLVANPPPSVRIACFFVNSRIPGEADSNAFIRAMVRQLSAIVGLEIGYKIPEGARSGQLIHLLGRAAEEVSSSGQRLVIMIDGLDEDKGHSPSIAYTLPRRLPAGVRVIVSSRTYPLLPPDVPGDHPLRDCERRTLEPSPHAIQIRDDAEYEIVRHLAISRHRDLIGFLVAAGGGGLSSSDLAELTGTRSSASVTDLMYTEFGRIIDALPRRGQQPAQPAWMLAHDMLLVTAKDRLAEDLSHYLQQINRWADRYRQEHWQANTPDYLLHSYAHMLLGVGDLDRAVDLVIDRQRHELMLSRTSTDALILNEIASVQLSLRKNHDPDLRSLARLAFHKFAIGARSAALPEGLPSVWAGLGDLDRGEALARTIPWPEERGRALVDVAYTIASVDPARAAALCASARAILPHIDRTGGKVGVLAGTVEVLAAFDADRAEQFANSLGDPRTTALGLAGVAAALADTDPKRAVKLCEKAARLAPPITDDYYCLDALTEPAKVLASIDSDRAEALAHKIAEPQIQAAILIAIADVVAFKDLERTKILCVKAEQLVEPSAASSWREGNRQDNLADLAAIVAAIDLSKAKEITGSIADPSKQVKALTNVAVAAAPHVPHQAEELALSLVKDGSSTLPLTKFASALALSDADRAEELAYTIDDIADRASALIGVMTAIGKTSSDRALKICDAVEGLVCSVSDPTKRASLLTGIASGIGGVARARAMKLCESAEQTARHAPDFMSIGCVVSKIAAALVRVEPDRAASLCRTAKFIAGNLVDGSGTDFVLAEVAVALAAIEPYQAVRVLNDIGDGELYADAVFRSAEGIARANRSHAGGLSRILKDIDYGMLFSPHEYGRTLEAIARADFKIARHIADSIPDSDALGRVIVLTCMARSLQEVSPQEAFGLMGKAAEKLSVISDPFEHAVSLAWVASAFALVDHDRTLGLLDEAERTASSIPSSRRREMTLARMVYPIAVADPGRAQRICESLVEEDWRAHALADICRVLSEAGGADSVFARSAAASLLAQTEYDLWGGDWTSSLNSLSMIDPQAIMAIADELDSELARYPDLASSG